MQNNSKIILLVLMFIIVFSFVRVEKMTVPASCAALNGNVKKTCLKKHINEDLDPDNKYYRYVKVKGKIMPRYGAGPVSGVDGKIAHFQDMIDAFNAAVSATDAAGGPTQPGGAIEENKKYCAGMTDNNKRTLCLKDRLGADTDEQTHHTEIEDASGCKTMKPYHRCYGHINWAKNTGSISNPQWYRGTDTNNKAYQLSKNSTTKDFQNHLFKQGAHWTQAARGTGQCPVSTPCYDNGEVSQIQK